MWIKWGDKIGLEMAKLASVPSVLPSRSSLSSPLFLETENTSPSFTLKGQCDAP